MSRTAKIALLPRDVREELNARMRDGESGPPLLEWLNDRPAIKEMVAQRFGGVAISPANLSAWRRGGYRSWAVNQESLEMTRDLVVDANSLKDGRDCAELTESMSAILASKLAWVLQNWACVGEKRFEQELQVLRIVSREVARVRKGNHNLSRLWLQQDYRADYTTKQWTKQLLEWAEKNREISSWLRTEWPNQDEAARYFLRSMGMDETKIESIMAEPDRVPPWKQGPQRPSEPKPENN